MSNEDETNRLKIDTLFRLADQSWRSFDTNRSYEWKMSLALWTVLAAFAALLAKGDVKIQSQLFVWFATTGIVLIFLAYWIFWTTGGWRHNYFEVEDTYDLLKRVRWLIGEPPGRAPLEGPKPKDRASDVFLAPRNWSRAFQLIVTFILAFVAIVATWS
jgi:hypothetical protein